MPHVIDRLVDPAASPHLFFALTSAFSLGPLANVAVWGAPVSVLTAMPWPTIALAFAGRFVRPLDGPHQA